MSQPTTTIPVPKAGRTFPNLQAGADYLKEHAHQHYYAVTKHNTRPNSIALKCYLGPSQYQKKLLADSIKAESPKPPSIPTCPFEAIVKHDPSTGHHVIKILNPKHDHPPSKERIPIEAYTRQRNPPAPAQPSSSASRTQPTIPQSHNQNPNMMIPSFESLSISSSSQIVSSSDPYLNHQYTTFITRMKALPTPTQTCLLTRFLLDVQLAEALTTSQIGPAQQSASHNINTSTNNTTANERQEAEFTSTSNENPVAEGCNQDDTEDEEESDDEGFNKISEITIESIPSAKVSINT
jgi:hypothetical protein